MCKSCLRALWYDWRNAEYDLLMKALEDNEWRADDAMIALRSNKYEFREAVMRHPILFDLTYKGGSKDV